jgi:hypothetical protein
MIAIFDIDSLIYEACYNADEFQEAADKFFNKYNDAIYNLNGMIKIDGVIPVGFCINNYRKKVDLAYKANRTSDKPKYFRELIDFVKEQLNVQTRSGIETDDLVVKFQEHYGKDNSIIISIDKDYRQMEGKIFNYRKNEIIKVSKEEAVYNFYSQMVEGDTADNVNYLIGWGKSWCKKNLTGKSEFGMRRAVYKLFKEVYRVKAKEMFVRCYLLLKLNVF